jgi:putative transposase
MSRTNFISYRRADAQGPTRRTCSIVSRAGSWLNLVERLFALITDKAIRSGSFTSVNQLVQRIDQFVVAHNSNCQPFKWTATADSILEKLHRLCSRICGTEH